MKYRRIAVFVTSPYTKWKKLKRKKVFIIRTAFAVTYARNSWSEFIFIAYHFISVYYKYFAIEYNRVDTYQSHEGVLYCSVHFKLLFAPKCVDDEPVQPRKPELIIRENQPTELPPDVVRGKVNVVLKLILKWFIIK